MKKILLVVFVSCCLILKGQHLQLNSGYPFKHNGTTCFFYPTNGLPVEQAKEADGIVRCFMIKHYPATAQKVSAKRKKGAKDSFNVSYAAADKGKHEAHYRVVFHAKEGK